MFNKKDEIGEKLHQGFLTISKTKLSALFSSDTIKQRGCPQNVE